MRKSFSLSVVLMVVAGMLLSACQTPAAPTAAPPPAQPAAPAQPAEPAQPAQPTAAPAQPAAKAFKVGLVTDVGKVDDKSFNQSAWEGVQMAVKELGVEAK